MNRKWWLVDALTLCVIIAYAVPLAAEDKLPTALPPTNWTGVAVAVVIGLAFAVGIWYLRNKPGAVAKAKEETTAVHTLAAKLSDALHTLTKSNAEVVATIPVALAATPPGAVPAGSAIAQSAGKAGTPGIFIIAVSGDPNADLPAINAQYFG